MTKKERSDLTVKVFHLINQHDLTLEEYLSMMVCLIKTQVETDIPLQTLKTILFAKLNKAYDLEIDHSEEPDTEDEHEHEN